MRPLAEAKQLGFEVEFAGPIPEAIVTDPLRLRQILLNLVSNAIKFTSRGEVRLTTRLAADDPEGPRLWFEVADTGPGLSAEQLSELFRPFAQGDSSTTRRFGGTGLGLAISQRLAGMLGGRVEVRSAPVQGSVFTFSVRTGSLAGVRLIESAAEALLARPTSDRDTPVVCVKLRGCVLLAEDGEDNREFMIALLRNLGLEVRTALNGAEALHIMWRRSGACGAGSRFAGRSGPHGYADAGA